MKHTGATGTARSATGTKAVRRAVAILRAFTDQKPELGLAELSRAVDLHKTTVHRLLATLEQEGLVARSRSAAYRLGPAAIALGTQALRGHDLRDIAHEELVRLAASTRETTTLEILIDDDVLIVDEVSGRSLVGAAPELGTRWPAYAASTGKVLLAERGGLVGGPRGRRLERLTSKTIATEDGLAEELALVRRQGYAVAREEVDVGFTAVGAAVRNHDRRAIAAVSVGGPSSRFDDARIESMVKEVCEAARRISARLGYPGAATSPGGS